MGVLRLFVVCGKLNNSLLWGLSLTVKGLLMKINKSYLTVFFLVSLSCTFSILESSALQKEEVKKTVEKSEEELSDEKFAGHLVRTLDDGRSFESWMKEFRWRRSLYKVKKAEEEKKAEEKRKKAEAERKKKKELKLEANDSFSSIEEA